MPKYLPPPTNQLLFKAQELGQLLDILDEAALLVESQGKQIAAVNYKTTELTAYTRSEIMKLSLGQLLSYDGSLNALLATRNFGKQLPKATLTTRNQQQIPVCVRTIPISQQLRLVTIEPVANIHKRHLLKEHQNTTLESIRELALTLQHSKPSETLSLTLASGSKLLGASTLAIYLGDGEKPQVRKVASWGDPDIFPAEILSPDLNYLLKPSLWVKGQRSIVTMLHQSARSAGLSFLTSTSIGETGAWIGVIVAGGVQPAADDTLQLIEILGALTSSIVRNTTLITNLHQTIDQNARNLAIIESFMDTVQDGVIMVSPDMIIQEVNPSAELILGYASSEVEGLNIDNIFIGTDRLEPAVKIALQGIATPNLGNTYLHRRDGSTFLAGIGAIPVTRDGNTLGVVILLRDKSKNEQIRIRTQQLEQRALLGEVTAVFAHEVRNPLNNISTGLQLLADNCPQDDPNQETIVRMRQDCQRLNDLMESVLTFSRTGNYTFMPIAITELIQQLVKRWMPRMSRVNVNHHIQIASGSHKVLGDQRALEQIFTNLISNAVQAMQETEGGTLAIKLTPKTAPSGRAIIQVDIADTGPGISDENRARIFDPFFTTKKNGTGLGLAITKQIITAHKGSIHLDSFPGGTVFHVKLPALVEMETTP